MKSLVSVVMPAYNGEKYIAKSIQSVLNQTYDNIELIIVEDCSTDKTADVIKSFHDERIRVFSNKKNMGIAYSTNVGISKSRGEYIALLDDDDIAIADRFSIQVEYMDKHIDIDILGGRSLDINSDDEIISYGWTPRNNPKYIKAMLLFECLDFRNGTAIFRKNFLLKNKLKYKDNYYGMQDFMMYVEASKCGCITSLNKYFLKYRVHGSSETSKRACSQNRKKIYAEIQRWSLAKSGFILSDNQYNIINSCFDEYDESKHDMNKFMLLYGVLSEIINQAKQNKIDYYDELVLVCKNKLSKYLYGIDLFANDISIDWR